ncbi:AbrB/MazE/SpoVT family DNA-binding domain-containing protein [Candidatus Tisiphia endosymbiont of Ceraclea dissimilis]|uniref:AbrB/MazE/SpoVT family DNA-binding domain-containing protein n=1 Tax=Candidatus Tisiphia endosymbiont of Ceraclea dissimilis TaxID=3077928 RepID=UPI003CCA92FE
MRVSSKGQVTIPINIRSKFGFLPDTEITFIEREDGVLLKKYQNQHNRGSKLLLHMSGKSTVKMSTDTIMKLTRS